MTKRQIDWRQKRVILKTTIFFGARLYFGRQLHKQCCHWISYVFIWLISLERHSAVLHNCPRTEIKPGLNILYLISIYVFIRGSALPYQRSDRTDETAKQNKKTNWKIKEDSAKALSASHVEMYLSLIHKAFWPHKWEKDDGIGFICSSRRIRESLTHNYHDHNYDYHNYHYF